MNGIVKIQLLRLFTNLAIIQHLLQAVCLCMKHNDMQYEFIIIGAGFSGLGMAIKLKKEGMTNFVVLDRNPHLGGTWWDNSYPGAACDVQSHLYSFSFEPNPNWSRQFSPQEEILKYMEHCATKYGLNEKIQYNSTVNGAEYNDDSSIWTVTTANGKSYQARYVISCSGGLSQPSLPEIKGLDDFKGKMFHTARWDKNFDITGKTVAVIGTGASAIQIVPAIVPKVKQLYVYQRTPSWVIPKPDFVIGGFRKKLFSTLPVTQYMVRGWMYWVHELMAIGFVANKSVLEFATKIVARHIKKSVKDETLRKKLTPNYTLGCKRILLSNDYYPALQQPNAEVVTDGIKEINEHGILTVDGKQRDVDAIVLATGFHAAEGMLVYDVKGKNGLQLSDAWKDGAEAYLGTSVAGFPNWFFVVGPNTGLGHTSVIIMIEAQIKYIMAAIKTMKQQNAQTLDVRPAVQKTFNEEMQQKLGKTVWQAGGCVSWYQMKNGKNVTIWPGFTFSFIQRTAKFEPDKYVMS